MLNCLATGFFSSLLELLKFLPDTLERTRRELELQIALGGPLMTIKGFGAPEVRAAYDRALELCRKIGETPELFPVVTGLYMFYITRAELKLARELAAQRFNLAQRLGDPALLLRAHITVGVASLYHGEPTRAGEHFDQALALYDPERHRSDAGLYQDPGVIGLAWAADALWYLGYPDQALKRSDEALALARKIAHPF